MKLKEKIRYIIATQIYLNPNGGFHGYDKATELIMNLLEQAQEQPDVDRSHDNRRKSD